MPVFRSRQLETRYDAQCVTRHPVSGVNAAFRYGRLLLRISAARIDTTCSFQKIHSSSSSIRLSGRSSSVAKVILRRWGVFILAAHRFGRAGDRSMSENDRKPPFGTRIRCSRFSRCVSPRRNGGVEEAELPDEPKRTSSGALKPAKLEPLSGTRRR